jgi:uracil-DNA glycosylase
MSFSTRLPDQSREAQWAELCAEMSSCRRCQQKGHDNIVPGAVFSGQPTAQIMIVGQAPGVTEVEAGRPFNGSSGRRLFEWLGSIGWKESAFRASQYMTAITKCYPGKGPKGRGDRVPTRAEQELCAPYLERELALVRPRILIPVGSLAVRRFLGPVKLIDVVGQSVQDGGRWVVPLAHPSGASLWLNRRENRERVRDALDHIDRLCRELGIMRHADMRSDAGEHWLNG